MKVSTSWHCAEGAKPLSQTLCIEIFLTYYRTTEDVYFGPKMRSEAEAIFAARKGKPDFVDYEFNDYKGTKMTDILNYT